MVAISTEEFEDIVRRSITSLPKQYQEHLENVAFIVEDQPSEDQKKQIKLRNDSLLFGLYEGVPLPMRQGTVKLIPDKITIFQEPIELISRSRAELYDRIARTVWHEVAHYYGLDHKRIAELS